MVLEVGLDSNEARTMSLFLSFCSKNKNGAGSRTRTYEARRREIYSLLSLPLDDSSNGFILSKIIGFYKVFNFFRRGGFFSARVFRRDALKRETREATVFLERVFCAIAESCSSIRAVVSAIFSVSPEAS